MKNKYEANGITHRVYTQSVRKNDGSTVLFVRDFRLIYQVKAEVCEMRRITKRSTIRESAKTHVLDICSTMEEVAAALDKRKAQVEAKYPDGYWVSTGFASLTMIDSLKMWSRVVKVGNLTKDIKLYCTENASTETFFEGDMTLEEFNEKYGEVLA